MTDNELLRGPTPPSSINISIIVKEWPGPVALGASLTFFGLTLLMYLMVSNDGYLGSLVIEASTFWLLCSLMLAGWLWKRETPVSHRRKMIDEYRDNRRRWYQLIARATKYEVSENVDYANGQLTIELTKESVYYGQRSQTAVEHQTFAGEDGETIAAAVEYRAHLQSIADEQNIKARKPVLALVLQEETRAKAQAADRAQGERLRQLVQESAASSTLSR